MNLKTIPVVLDWNHDREIGSMTIDVDKLPQQPDFVITLGYRNEIYPRYVLTAVSVVSDKKYKEYLDNQALVV